jgi:hypothetical protein
MRSDRAAGRQRPRADRRGSASPPEFGHQIATLFGLDAESGGHYYAANPGSVNSSLGLPRPVKCPGTCAARWRWARWIGSGPAVGDRASSIGRAPCP